MRRYFSEKSLSEDDLNIDAWESIFTEEMDDLNRSLFIKRKEAVDLFFRTDIPVTQIAKTIKICKSEIYRMVDRCITYDEKNNKLVGYRALIPNTTVASYTRNSFKEYNNNISTNFSGSFEKLLKEYPSLKEFLIQEYFKTNSLKNSAREFKISYKNLHRKFIAECRKLGIKSTEYPFNTESLARKSVERYIKKISTSYITEVTINSRGQSLMLLNNVDNSISSNSRILRPLERVEFDGHKIDSIIAIEYSTPGGEKVIDIINRIWILTIVDVATRAILGYHISLSKEYSKEDIKKCLQSSIIPWQPKNLTIPGLDYSKSAGFPSSKFHNAEYALWDEICYDNAKSHLSNEIKEILTRQIGCTINMGPVGVPVRRPIVERLFKKLEESGFHRLPTTTGSNVLDSKRHEAEKNAIKFTLTISALEELCDVIIANYNGTPHESNNGFTPLEIFESRLSQGMTVTQIPIQDRKSVNLFPIHCTRVVKGNLQNGRRPYIHYKQVRYSSSELSNEFDLVNNKLKILINTDDLRTLETYREDGSFYGILKAVGVWGQTPHNLKFRDCINKFKRERYFNYTNEEDPIDAFQKYLESNALNNKNLRTLLAELQSYKKRYNIESNNIEKKKVAIRIKKDQIEIQKEIINLRKTKSNPEQFNPTKSNVSFHDLMIEDIKQKKEREHTNNQNFLEDLITTEREKNHKKRKSIIF